MFSGYEVMEKGPRRRVYSKTNVHLRRIPLGAKKLGPPQRVWPLIMAMFGDGGLLFPDCTKNNITRILKFTLTKIGGAVAYKYNSEAFRRGDTHEITQTANSVDFIKGS